MSGFMWKATVRNVNRALKEINAFEWEGDYRPAAREALKRILEDEVDRELGQYLGRGRYDRRGEGVWGDYRNGSRIRHVLTELGDLMVWMPRTRKKVCLQGIGGLSEADADGGSIDFGVFCFGDEYTEGIDGSFLVRGAGICFHGVQ